MVRKAPCKPQHLHWALKDEKSALAMGKSLPNRQVAVTATFPMLLSGGLSVPTATIPEGGRDVTTDAVMLPSSLATLKTQACCPKKVLDVQMGSPLSPAGSQGLP